MTGTPQEIVAQIRALPNYVPESRCGLRSLEAQLEPSAFPGGRQSGEVTLFYCIETTQPSTDPDWVGDQVLVEIKSEGCVVS